MRNGAEPVGKLAEAIKSTFGDFAKFKDWTSKKWQARSWQDKLAAGFTVSASWGGDKQNTLYQLLTLAQQHGMVWVGLGLAPGTS